MNSALRYAVPFSLCHASSLYSPGRIPVIRHDVSSFTYCDSTTRHEDGESAADYANYAEAELRLSGLLVNRHSRNSRNPRLVPIAFSTVIFIYLGRKRS